MKKTGGDFGAKLARMLPLIIRQVSRHQESILARGDLTVSNIVVFDVLRVKGSCTMSELARTLNFTMSAVTGIIDKMIKAGLVKRERSKTDRRVVEVMLLEKGKNIAMKINDERRDMTNEMFSVLTSSERDEYLRLIGKVYDSIKGDER